MRYKPKAKIAPIFNSHVSILVQNETVERKAGKVGSFHIIPIQGIRRMTPKVIKSVIITLNFCSYEILKLRNNISIVSLLRIRGSDFVMLEGGRHWLLQGPKLSFATTATALQTAHASECNKERVRMLPRFEGTHGRILSQDY